MDKQVEVISVHSKAIIDPTSTHGVNMVDDETSSSGFGATGTVDHVSIETATPAATKSRRLHELWMEEILWCVVSCLFLVVIVAVLRTFDGKALPTLPLSITLNTFLAFFTTLTKAAFMIAVCEALSQWKWNWFATRADRPLHDFQLFDDASRGAWGSLQLLLGRLRGRHLATLGAILPVISIVTSPITQQTIQYPMKRSEVNGTATVQAVRRYKSDEDWMGYGTGPILAASSSGLTAAHGVAPVPPAPPNCTSEECTFPRYNTLGICTRVNNITSALSVKKITNSTRADWTTVQKSYLDQGAYKDLDLSVAYNASLPGRVCHMVNPFPAGISICGSPGSMAEQDEDFRRANFFSIAVIAGGPRGWYLDDNALVASDWKDIQHQAYEINLAACVKTFEARFVDGRPKMEVVATSFAVKTELSQRGAVRCQPVSFSDNDSWYCSTDYMHRESMNDSTPLMVLKDPLDPENRSLDANDYYTIDLYSLSTISTLVNMLYAAIWTWEAATHQTSTTNSMRVDTIWGDIITYLSRTNDTRKQMTNLQLAANNIATAYTNGLLTSPPMRGAPNALPVQGTNWASVTFVEIKWGWLSFLVVELVAAVVFLAMTITYTHRHGVQVLKSSALATFFAPAEDCRAAIGGVGRVGEMKKKARSAFVRFTGTEMVLTDRDGGTTGPNEEGGRAQGRAGALQEMRRRSGKTW